MQIIITHEEDRTVIEVAGEGVMATFSIGNDQMPELLAGLEDDEREVILNLDSTTTVVATTKEGA